jgi:hypothetical protein
MDPFEDDSASVGSDEQAMQVYLKKISVLDAELEI